MAKTPVNKSNKCYRCLVCREAVNGKDRDKHKKAHAQTGLFAPATDFGFPATVGLVISKEGWAVIRAAFNAGQWSGRNSAEEVTAQWNRKGRAYEQWAKSDALAESRASETPARAARQKAESDRWAAERQEQADRWAAEDKAAAAAYAKETNHNDL